MNDDNFHELLMRVYYSSHHLWAAEHLLGEADIIEQAHTGRSVFDIKHRAYVTNSIISSINFLEAAINEILRDCAEVHMSYIKSIPSDKIKVLAVYWSQTEDNTNFQSTLEKYQTVYNVITSNNLDKSKNPYQDVALVIKLRNMIIHYKPRTLGHEDPSKFINAIKGKFVECKIYKDSGNPYFPDKCLGVDCSKWVFNSVKSFTDIFFGSLGITPNYQIVNF